jgi:hypothetical protein
MSRGEFGSGSGADSKDHKKARPSLQSSDALYEFALHALGQPCSGSELTDV